MPRFVLLILAALFLSTSAAADTFDNYTNTILSKVPQAKGVLPLKQLTLGQLTDHSGAIPGLSEAFLVVKTNEGRWSKLLVIPAAQKLADKKSTPILQIEKFVTYREGEERTIHVQGGNIRLFAGFLFNLDIGQVVPEAVGGDIRFKLTEGKPAVEAVGNAEFYLLTRPLPEATPKKSGKLVVGKAFEARYFDGTYKLYDDGRRSGKLVLKVGENNLVYGHYYSDKDGAKYDVEGKLGAPLHAIQFKVTFPRSEQVFTGWMFTGDGRVIAGSSRLQGREVGFYAVREE